MKVVELVVSLLASSSPSSMTATILAACSRVRMPVGLKAPLSVPSNTPMAVITSTASVLVISAESLKSLLTALAETTIMPTIRAMAITRLRVRLRFLIWISSF